MNGAIISLPADNGIYEISLLPDIRFINAINTTVYIDFNDDIFYTSSFTGSNNQVWIDLQPLITAFLLDYNTKYAVFTIRLTDASNWQLSQSFSVHKITEDNVLLELTNNKLYFQKNIPDLYFPKTLSDTIIFELKAENKTVLTEEYLFDIDYKIRIRNLGDIVEKYFGDTDILLNFSYTITQGTQVHTINFIVLKCEADMTVDAGSWTASNFLTRAYREKRTSKSRNEYLSFLQKLSYGTVTVNYKAYYMVELVVTEKTGVLESIPASGANKITTFNSSLGALVTAAALALDATIIQYNIWLTGTGFETAKYTYLVDYFPYRNFKSFVFVNCFGVLETFTATGLTVNKKTNEFNLANIENHYRKITQDFVSEKTCNSGYLSDVEMEWIDDLVKSYTVGLYTPGISGMSEEITLVGVEKQDSEANELQAFSFGYRRSKNNHLQFTNAAQGIFDNTFDETFN